MGFIRLCATIAGFKDRAHYISTAAYHRRASLSRHGTATERSENATSSCSTARKHITMPTESIMNTSQLSFQLYSQMSAYAQSSVYLVIVAIITIILLVVLLLPTCNSKHHQN